MDFDVRQKVMDTAITSNFGISIPYVLAQLFSFALILIIPIINVRATQKVIRVFSGGAIPLWILTIWLLPIIGFISAFAALKKEEE